MMGEYKAGTGSFVVVNVKEGARAPIYYQGSEFVTAQKIKELKGLEGKPTNLALITISFIADRLPSLDLARSMTMEPGRDVFAAWIKRLKSEGANEV